MKCDENNYMLRNEHGEIHLDEALGNAISLIQTAAMTLQISPADFMEIFNDGLPDCPYCDEDE